MSAISLTVSPSSVHFALKSYCVHITTMSNVNEFTPPEISSSAMCSDKTTLRKNRQKRLAIQARIIYREQTIKAFQRHLKQGTFPKRMKSIKPFPKMNTSEGQAVVNAACDQVQCVILEQMVVEEQQKLTQEQDMYQTLKEQQLTECAPRKKSDPRQPRKPKKSSSVAQLQEELALLQTSMAQLCSLIDTSKKDPDTSYHLNDI